MEIMCNYCGETYGINKLHDCSLKSAALMQKQEECIKTLEKELYSYRLTIRDQFAMAALAGLCGLNWCSKEIPNPSPKDHAVQAYRYADAMMVTRREGS